MGRQRECLQGSPRPSAPPLYLVFLRHEGYLTVERANEVEGRLSDLQDELAALAGRLREGLGRALKDLCLPYGPELVREVLSSQTAMQGRTFAC